MRATTSRKTSRLNVTLWTVQLLLALLFLFAGGMKLVVPIAALTAQAPLPLPGAFLRLIGVAETLGALGLVLPGLTGIRTRLTPLAAAGLVIIMTGATVVTLVGGGGAGALVPMAVGALAAFVADARWRRAPLRARNSSARIAARQRVDLPQLPESREAAA